jgi:UDP-N-acetylmuramoylalanine--D-glutamate ligase
MNLIAQHIAVFGAGVSGSSSLALAKHLGAEATLYDEAPGGLVFTNPSNCDCVVYSPGFRLSHPWILKAREAGVECMTEIDFAARFFPGKIYAITGTNGKSTSIELLTLALQEAGLRAQACGNIGIPFSDWHTWKNPFEVIAVCEVSSFQAEALAWMRPDALVWTNFDEDHLNRHASMKDYFDAKYKLVELSAFSVIGASVAKAANDFGLLLPGNVRIVDWNELAAGPVGSVFQKFPQRENYALLSVLFEELNLPRSALDSAARQLKLSEHRIEFVAEIKGVQFWNDSKGTNFASALAALDYFDRKPLWIAGGSNKGGDLGEFARKAASRIAGALLIGETGVELARHLKAFGVERVFFCDKLAQAVSIGFNQWSTRGDIILLSPGFASFDEFENYAHRGKVFKEAIFSLTDS